MKIAVIALVVGSGFFSNTNSELWDDLLPFGTQVMYYIAKPYIGTPLLLGSGILTMLWCRSKTMLVIHMIAYIILGYFFNGAWIASIAERSGIESAIVWIFVSLILYCVTIVLFAAAIDGSRTVKVEAADGMNSIYPEKR